MSVQKTNISQVLHSLAHENDIPILRITDEAGGVRRGEFIAHVADGQKEENPTPKVVYLGNHARETFSSYGNVDGETIEVPLYEHVCKECVFLGVHRGADLYFCESEKPYTILTARTGSEVQDFESCTVTDRNKFSEEPLLNEARRRAYARRLFVPDDLVVILDSLSGLSRDSDVMYVRQHEYKRCLQDRGLSNLTTMCQSGPKQQPSNWWDIKKGNRRNQRRF